jgi:mono/diheme cytochrome c family protein
MRLHRLALAALAALVLAAAGCGGDDDDGGGDTGGAAPDTGAQTSTAGGETSGGSDPRQVFANTCGSCHTLAAADTEGQVGPNLDELQPDADRVRKAIEEGPGVMPNNLLEGAEADAVAQYVADNAGK